MNKRILILCCAVSLASPVLAADKIIVIKPDGTSEEFVMPDPAAPPAAPTQPEPKVKVFKAPDKPSILAPETTPVAKPSVKKASAAKPVTPPKPKRPATAASRLPKPESPGKVVEQPQPMEVPEDQIVTEKLAKRIALRIAPPARDIDVFLRTYEDTPVYLVRFKTDTGPFDVLVDMITGDIVATKEPGQ